MWRKKLSLNNKKKNSVLKVLILIVCWPENGRPLLVPSGNDVWLTRVEISYQQRMTNEVSLLRVLPIGWNKFHFWNHEYVKCVKSRYKNHTCSFRNERYRNSTELSKYVWGLKDKKTDYQIRWRSIRHARSYSNVTKKCNLYLWEKYYIICRPNMATLNNRNELVSSCRHAKKFLLNNVII